MNNIFSAASKIFGQPHWNELLLPKLILSFLGVVLMTWVITKKK
jgi:hypothetical protein